MPSGGMPWTPASRWSTRSAQRRSSSRSAAGTPRRSLTTSIGRPPAEAAGKSRPPPPAPPLEVADRERAYARLELGDPARGETLRDQAAHARVPRRVHAEEGEHRA